MLAFEKNDGKRASWWAARMLTLPEPAPKDRPWTHEAKWYGWAGHDLAARAYRLADMTADANALQLVYHKHTEPTIRITQKTLGNSTRSVSFRDAWLSTAARPEIVEHYFQIKADDAETMAMSKQFMHHRNASCRHSRERRGRNGSAKQLGRTRADVRRNADRCGEYRANPWS
jgi:hypothetical protein